VLEGGNREFIEYLRGIKPKRSTSERVLGTYKALKTLFPAMQTKEPPSFELPISGFVVEPSLLGYQ